MSTRSEVGLKIQFQSVEQRDGLIRKFHDNCAALDLRDPFAYDSEILFEQFKEDDIDGYGKLLLNDSDAAIVYDNADVRWYGSYFIIALENFVAYARKAANNLEFPNSGGYIIVTDQDIETDYWTSLDSIYLTSLGIDRPALPQPYSMIWTQSFIEWA